MRFVVILACLVLVSYCGYDQSLSKLTAAYCAISHCNRSSIQSWTCKLCKATPSLTDLHYIANKEYHNVGIVGYSAERNAVIVAWRGSIDWRNWIEDINVEFIQYKRCKNCQMHLGFHFAYKVVEKELLETVGPLLNKYPNASIIVSGHSLGGAMATISALELQLQFNKVSALYAFGCPRVGNIHFSQFLKLKIPERYRPIHNKDLFAHLPYREQGYHHYGHEVMYNEDFTEFKVCNEGGEDATCSSKYFPHFNTDDHVLYFYNMDETVC